MRPATPPPPYEPASKRNSSSSTTTLPQPTTPTAPSPVSFDVATEPSEKLAALRLICDSIAQQRQIAASSMIWHRGSLLVLAVVLAIVCVLLRKLGSPDARYREQAGSRSVLSISGDTFDWGTLVLAWVGCVMVWLGIVRLVTEGYIERAERVGRGGFRVVVEGEREEEGEEEESEWETDSKSRSEAESESQWEKERGLQIIVCKSVQSGDVVGTLVFGRRDHDTDSGRVSEGVIYAWTVDVEYRAKGFGRVLLERARFWCQLMGWQGPVFAEGHVHASVLVWPMFAREFEKREKKARAVLKEVTGRIHHECLPGRGDKGKKEMEKSDSDEESEGSEGSSM